MDQNVLKIIYTAVAILIVVLLRAILLRIIKKFAHKFALFQSRTLLILSYVNFLSFFLISFCLLFIWGIKFKDIGLFMSSVFAVIGVAFFAQWSILSNITSGIIMFFTFPYKIGDFIKIHDGDNSIYGHIVEIRAFHVLIETLENEQVTYPNSLMLQKGISILNEENIGKYKAQLKLKKKDTDPTDV